jgi:hypothetical protein
VLVLASAPTEVTATRLRKSILIQNNGPNPIWAALGDSSKCVLNKCIKIDALGGVLSMDDGEGWSVWLIAATADQVTGAATDVVEVR